MITELLTVEQFAEMIETESEKYELADGEPTLVPGAAYRHNSIRDRLMRRFGNYFDVNPIGDSVSETPCRIGENTVRIPDLSVFLSARLDLIDRRKFPVPFPPDIAIEVLSPSEKAMDVRKKAREYLAAGSAEVWILDDTNTEVSVHTNAGVRLLTAAETLASPLLPGFAVTVAELFAGL